VTSLELTFSVTAGSAIYLAGTAWHLDEIPHLYITDLDNNWVDIEQANSSTDNITIRLWSAIANSTGDVTITLHSTAPVFFDGVLQQASWMAFYATEVTNYNGEDAIVSSGASGDDMDPATGLFNPTTGKAPWFYLVAFSHANIGSAQPEAILRAGDWNLENKLISTAQGLPISVLWKQSTGAQEGKWLIDFLSDWVAVGAAWDRK